MRRLVRDKKAGGVAIAYSATGHLSGSESSCGNDGTSATGSSTRRADASKARAPTPPLPPHAPQQPHPFLQSGKLPPFGGSRRSPGRVGIRKRREGSRARDVARLRCEAEFADAPGYVRRRDFHSVDNDGATVAFWVALLR